ncbi:Zinc carboxypeptidase A 1 [Gryllus bimaculatus]|nr:Zinc carboxypeptidase A 1 [Gryllus bimaculatus]
MVLAVVVDASNINRSHVPQATVPLWLSRMATIVSIAMLVTAMTALARAAALGDALDDRARFDSYRVYRVVPHNEDQLTVLKHLQKSLDELDFWKGPGRVGVPVDIMVPPHLLPDFEDTIKGNNMNGDLYIKDVQRLVDQQTNVGRSGHFSWSDYHRLDEIYAWLDALEEQYPDIVTVIVGGSTYEGRQIKGVKVSFKSGNPGVFLEGGIHAREWVSPATVTYILNQLLTSDEPRIRDIAQNFDWYIFPVFNPDGYEYTHTTNRLWRKTRSPTSDTCHGVDPNRNWGFHWKDGGSSSDPCSNHYAGPEAFSEIETRSMSQYITSIADKIDVYLAFHSIREYNLSIALQLTSCHNS